MERSSGAAPPRQPGGSGNGDLLTVQVERPEADVSVVSLAGELDLSTIPRVDGRLFDELAANPAVVVDLSQLSFIDSSGIGLLIRAHRVGGGGKAGVLHTVIRRESQVDRVFRLAGIDRALLLHPDRDEALAALRATASQNGSRAA